MGLGFWLLIAIHVVLCLVLVLLVLVQNDKAGGLSAFGGPGAAGGYQGAGAATFIQKLTRGVAVAFMVVVMLINIRVAQHSAPQASASALKQAVQAEQGLGSIIPQAPLQMEGLPAGQPAPLQAPAPAGETTK